MIDIHSHILFGVDDGAIDIEESLSLARQAVAVGYTDIVCSSHYLIGRFENQNYNENFETLKNRLLEEKIPLNIHKGNEFALDMGFFEHEGKINSMAGSKYLLVELKRELIFVACKAFFKEILAKGYIPIFAHVERYPQIKISEFRELVEMGVVLQMNLKAVASPKHKVRYLLENGYISIIATDSHRIGKRDYNVGEYLKNLERYLGKEFFRLLMEVNPRKVIESKEIVTVIKYEGDSDEKKKTNGIGNVFSDLFNELFERFFYSS